MDIQELPLSAVKPYSSNPRVISDIAIDKVALSIKEYGFRIPIIIDKDNVIVAGHTRYKAAVKLGLETVPCIIVDDLTPEQIKAFRIADNKTAEFSTWDNELLKIELEELKAFDLNLEMTGLDDWEIDNLLNPVSDIDLQDFFVEKEQKEKEPKKVKCPSCGCEFEQ